MGSPTVFCIHNMLFKYKRNTEDHYIFVRDPDEAEYNQEIDYSGAFLKPLLWVAYHSGAGPLT